MESGADDLQNISISSAHDSILLETQIVDSPPGINISLDARVGNMESNFTALQSSIDLLTKSFLAAQGLKVAGGYWPGVTCQN